MKKKEKALQRALRRDIQSSRESILYNFNNRCQVCGLNIKEFLEIHHLLPITMGGNNELYNLTALCPTCHKALHIWLDQKKGSEVINSYYKNHISWDEYEKLADILSRSIKFRKERADKISEFYDVRNQRCEDESDN